MSAGAFFLALLITLVIREYALKHLLDMPNQRSSHQQPTPRGGGLGIVLALMAVLPFFFVFGWVDDSRCLALLAGLLIAVIGFWDDHQHIAARWRICWHFLGAAIALYFLQGFPPIILGDFVLDMQWPGYILGCVFLVWMLNLFNFMDGIDGIAGSEAVFVASALAAFMLFVEIDLAWLGLVIAMASLGFLVCNWPPAKIFMGDVGSGFLGFLLGVVILLYSHRQPVFLTVGLILFAVFIVDATYTLLARFFTGAKWYEAHCSHAYQKLARQLGHVTVVNAVWAINLFWLLPLALTAFLAPGYAWAILVLAYLPLILVARRFAAGTA